MKSLFEKNGSTYTKSGRLLSSQNLGAPNVNYQKSADMAGQGGSILRNIRRENIRL